MKIRWRIIMLCLMSPIMALAQTLKLEVLKPQFKFGDAEPSTFTTAWFITVDLPVWGKLNLVAQLPFAMGKLEGGSVPTEDETIGNPAVGLRFKHERLDIELSLRLPLAKEGSFAGFVGVIADFDRQEAFIADLVPLAGMVRSKIDISKFNIRPYAGATLNVVTDTKVTDNDFAQEIFNKLKQNSFEMHVLYGAEGWWVPGKFNLGAAFNGRVWPTSGGNFRESAVHQMTFRTKYNFGKFTPSLMFRAPFDDLSLDYVIGLDAELKL
ncbi:MAG: hypothetical protein ACREOO_02135 [bacterium]